MRLRLGLGQGQPAAHSLQDRCLLRGSPKPPFPFCGGQVLTGRQQQIQEKIEQNRRAQEESLRHREQLIQNLEEARESARREKEESEELKSARKQELEAQVGPSGRSSLSEGMRAAATGPVWTLHRGGTGFRALAYVQPGTLPSLKPMFIYLLLMQFTLHCRASSLWGSLIPARRLIPVGIRKHRSLGHILRSAQYLMGNKIIAHTRAASRAFHKVHGTTHVTSAAPHALPAAHPSSSALTLQRGRGGGGPASLLPGGRAAVAGLGDFLCVSRWQSASGRPGRRTGRRRRKRRRRGGQSSSPVRCGSRRQRRWPSRDTGPR